MRYLFLFVVLLAGMSSCYTQPSQTQVDPQNEDRRLMVRVKEAVGRNVPRDRIESYVGTVSTIDTSIKKDRLSFEYAHFDFDRREDSDVSELSEIGTAAREGRLLYWIRPVRFNNPRFIGVIWTNDGARKIVYCEILSPE